MLETTIQSDTILKNLDQAVELKVGSKIQLQRKLIEPSKIRMVDSISRKDSTSSQTSQKTASSQFRSPRNNFQMDTIPRIEAKELDAIIEVTPNSGIHLPEKKIERNRPDWAVGIFILAFVIFASVRIFFNKYLNHLFNATLNYGTASRLFRERSLNLTHAAFRLDIHFMLVFSFFLFQLGRELGISYDHLSFFNYLILLISVIAYFFIKRIAYLIIGLATESLNETQEYVYNIDIYNRVLGLILLPVSLLIAFSSFDNPRILYILGSLLVLIVYFLSLLRGSKILLRKHFSIFYLILYLCTLEILPLVFVHRLMLV